MHRKEQMMNGICFTFLIFAPFGIMVALTYKPLILTGWGVRSAINIAVVTLIGLSPLAFIFVKPKNLPLRVQPKELDEREQHLDLVSFKFSFLMVLALLNSIILYQVISGHWSLWALIGWATALLPSLLSRYFRGSE